MDAPKEHFSKEFIENFTQFVETLIPPVKELNTKRFLAKDQLKSRYSAKSFSFPRPPVATLSSSWEDAFFSAVSFPIPKKHAKGIFSKTCICAACVENPKEFNPKYLFSDVRLDFYPELRSMMLELDVKINGNSDLEHLNKVL